jgi:hypothetical protein
MNPSLSLDSPQVGEGAGSWLQKVLIQGESELWYPDDSKERTGTGGYEATMTDDY